MLKCSVNEVLGDHNVDKQMTDSRGEVCPLISYTDGSLRLTTFQVAYLMADISNVNVRDISDLYHRLESLSCMSTVTYPHAE